MRLLSLPGEGLRLRFEHDEVQLLDRLLSQFTELLRSHSSTELDPDPLFASLEVGGTDQTPEDPALARLFPDAFEDAGAASTFRRVTEQGLVNRKLHDAFEVVSALGFGAESFVDEAAAVEVDVTQKTMPAWVRTLTALRLVIAARIGLQAEGDHARLLAAAETRSTVIVYDWLAAILDAVLRMHERS